MPELVTVEGFLKDLKKIIRDFDDPAGPTILTSVYFPPGEYAKGGLMPHDRNDWGALREMDVLDVDDLPRDLRGRRVHSVQRVGSILEILLVRDDFDPEREDDQVVDAIRIIFKNCAEMGVAAETDVGAYPLSYVPGTEGMTVGRTRVAALFNYRNQRGGNDSRVAGVLDGLSRPNWAEIKVRHHVLKKEDGGLGSEKWFLRTYRQGHDPIRWRLEWAEEVVDTIMGWRGAPPFNGIGFTGPYAEWERQGRCTYLQMLHSKRLFPGHGDIVSSENVEITDIQTEGRVRGATPINYFRRHENGHDLARALAVDSQLLHDMSFQDKAFDIMTANIAKKAVMACNFLVAFQQPNFVLVGKPTPNLKDVHLKAYVHKSLLETDEWREAEREFGLRRLGKILKRRGTWLTPGAIGVGICGFVTNGPKTDKIHYDQQSVPGPKQKKVGPPEKHVRTRETGGGEAAEKYRTKGGKNHQRLRDIRTLKYGTAKSLGDPGDREWGRAVYEHVMRYLGIQDQMVSGHREDPTFKKKAPKTAEQAAEAQERKRQKRRLERRRKKKAEKTLEEAAQAWGKRRRKRRRDRQRKKLRAHGPGDPASTEVPSAKEGKEHPPPPPPPPPPEAAGEEEAPAVVGSPRGAPGAHQQFPPEVDESPLQAEEQEEDDEDEGASEAEGSEEESEGEEPGGTLDLELPLQLTMPESMKGHCTKERFERAQQQLMEVMAETTGPDVRLEREALRASARHVVRDTGLLDFLIAHIAGSLVRVGERTFRFCRRRNEAGHVECWLEEEEYTRDHDSESDSESEWEPEGDESDDETS